MLDIVPFFVRDIIISQQLRNDR